MLLTRTTRTAAVVAAGALIALTGCTNTAPTPGATPSVTATPPPAASDAGTDANAAAQTPEERVNSWVEADAAAASTGWKDLSHIDKFLTPKAAKLQRQADQEDAKNGVAITGKRKLTDMSIVEETDSTAVVEFCDDVSALKATKNGKPVKISNSEPGVARYTLIRESSDKPWMISEQGYYDKKEVGSCAEYFGG